MTTRAQSAREIVVYEHATCGTCKKALAYLAKRGATFRKVPIVAEIPDAKTIAGWMARSGLPGKKWLNTSGQSYRALVAEKGKAWVDALDDAAIAKLLAADGKLVKRPVALVGDRVLVGFREDAWSEALG